ncbi:hypothetical protein CATMQ487_00980 [Sphaerotilus microaerophilus]|uniref:Uncharacterized protein n=1 Tax=Sphaerotilus microaerophilus TaxID=2914710 RepID=A0ABN6PDV6_9BURK|nr:hypothetical protein CATMQ487_00980 [Sphaerotilus sp. FB-5]
MAGAPRVPSEVWQAAQTWVPMAWPLAMSAFAAGLVSAAATEDARAAAASRARSDGANFMVERRGTRAKEA